MGKSKEYSKTIFTVTFKIMHTETQKKKLNKIEETYKQYAELSFKYFAGYFSY